MKYCKDCKFFIAYMNKNNGYPFCHAPVVSQMMSKNAI